MKFDHFHHFDSYLDYCLYLCCYIHNVLVDVSFDLLNIFHLEFGSLCKTLKQTLYLIDTDKDCSNSINLDRRYKCLTIVSYLCYLFIDKDSNT